MTPKQAVLNALYNFAPEFEPDWTDASDFMESLRKDGHEVVPGIANTEMLDAGRANDRDTVDVIGSRQRTAQAWQAMIAAAQGEA